MTAVHYQVEGVSAREIVASVETGVREGTLPAGAVLLPVRALAKELGLAPGTVASAYRALRDRGLVTADGRRGTRVSARPPVASRVRPAAPTPADALDLSTGQPDPALLPALGPALAQLGPGPAAAPPARVLPALRQLGQVRLAADGVPSDAVTVTSGALDGLERVLVAHLRAGDAVAVEDPGWPNLLDLAAGLGLRVVPVAVDDHGPRPEALAAALRAGARAAVVTSRAQNPTGAAVTERRSTALRAVLAGHPATLVVEDDHAGELAGVPLSALVGATRSWAFVRSVSKPLGPDLRLALVAGDETTVSRVEGRLAVTSGWVSTVLQQLVVALWSDPSLEFALQHAAQTYANRRVALVAALDARGIPAVGRTGINVWVPVQDETEVVSRLLLNGYIVAPGARFRQQSQPGVRITVSGLTDAALPGLVAAIAGAPSHAERPSA